MAKFSVIVGLATCLAFVTTAATAKLESCIGCVKTMDKSTFAEVLPELKKALAIAHIDIQVDKIISYKTQLVAGMKRIVEFENKELGTCEASWVDKPWISPEPQDVNVSGCWKAC